MSIDDRKQLNFAELIVLRGTSSSTASKDFILSFNETDSGYTAITYQEFYQNARLYGHVISVEKEVKAVSSDAPLKVGVIMENCPEFLYILAACSFTNATLVALNSLRSGEALAYDINHADVDILFTDKNLVETVFDASAGFVKVQPKDILVAGDHPVLDKIVSVAERLGQLPSVDSFDEQALRVDQTAMIIFTSGTTGAPKGIEINWNKLMDVGANTVKALNYTKDDVGYICTPLCHSNAMYLNYMPALVAGACIGIRSRFSASKFVADITQCKATVWNCVGKPVTYVLNTIGKKDYSSLPLRTVISTGTTAGEQKKFSDIFGLELFVEVYGSTETGAITVKTLDDPPLSVGKRNPTKPFIILKEQNGPNGFRQQLDVGDIGEIAVNNESLGDSAFRGYYRNPESTKKKLYTHSDGEVYYLTGDLGRIDADENLYFMGRTGEWYRKKGENRSEAAAEEYLSCFDDIISMAVFGIPDATSQEDYLVAVIETKEPQSFNIEGFVDYANRGDKGTVPDFIRLVSAMPKTKTLKIIKSTIKKVHIKRTGSQLESEADIIYAMKGKGVEMFDHTSYQELIDSYLPQSKERLSTFLDRLATGL